MLLITGMIGYITSSAISLLNFIAGTFLYDMGRELRGSLQLYSFLSSSAQLHPAYQT